MKNENMNSGNAKMAGKDSGSPMPNTKDCGMDMNSDCGCCGNSYNSENACKNSEETGCGCGCGKKEKDCDCCGSGSSKTEKDCD